jgi:dephospho-CoA kinase
MLQSFGRTVLSADQEARDLMTQRPSLRHRIASEFGSDVYTTDGSLDRELLAQRAFQSLERTLALNAIVHPAVIKSINARIRRLPRERRCPYVVVEAALLYESGLDASLDFVVVIDAPREMRIQRVMRRDGSSRDKILRRMKAQLSSAALRERADIVLMNRHDTINLRSRVAFLNNFLVAAAQR